MSGQDRAWNSSPDRFGGKSKNRLTNSGKEPSKGVRCTYDVDGQVCDTFPSWEVPGTSGRERRCQSHRGM